MDPGVHYATIEVVIHYPPTYQFGPSWTDVLAMLSLVAEDESDAFVQREYLTPLQRAEYMARLRARLCASADNEALQDICLSSAARRIQRAARRWFRRQYDLSAGPALHDRTLCVNETDVLLLDPVSDIPADQFFSIVEFNSNRGLSFVYGFCMQSFQQLLNPVPYRELRNPYTNIPLSPESVAQFERRVRLGALLGIS